MRRKVEDLVGFLQDNEIVALGDHPNWPRSDAKALVPNGLSVEEAKSVVTAALTSSRLRLAMLRGTMLKPSATPAEQTEVLSLIATLLPGCSLVCLNLGEWSQASPEAYEMILKNLSETGIGHLYWNTPETVQGTDALKPYAIEILRENRKKHFYLMQAADGEVWTFLKGGCQAWWNPQKDRYLRAKKKKTFVRGVHSVAQEYKRKYQENLLLIDEELGKTEEEIRRVSSRLLDGSDSDEEQPLWKRRKQISSVNHLPLFHLSLHDNDFFLEEYDEDSEEDDDAPLSTRMKMKKANAPSTSKLNEDVSSDDDEPLSSRRERKQ